MTGLQLDTRDLGAQVPDLVRATAVVAIVPATELRGWSAQMAWEVARAVASSGRRTALIDCFVDAPTLHTVAGAPNNEGLVDAFEYGVSFNRIVQQQPQANLFFIPSGTFASDAQPLMENPRWRRLSAGFRHEEALLLLYVAPEHLAGLAAEPDGIIALAPAGLDTAARDVPALMEAIGRGMPLLAVVADTDSVRVSGASRAIPEPASLPAPGTSSPAATAVPAAPPFEGEAAGRRSRVTHPQLLQHLSATEPGTRPLAWVALLVVVALALVWVFRDRLRGSARRTPAAAVAARDGAPPPVAGRADSAAPAAATPRPADTLRWAVRAASFGTSGAAWTLADTLEAAGTPTMIAPLRLANGRQVFRVYAGPFADPAGADSALRALRAAGRLARSAGERVNVPLAVALQGGLSAEAARAERVRLRRAGVPAYALAEPNGTFRLWAGAYEAAVQAALLTDFLTPTGAGALVPRVGAMR